MSAADLPPALGPDVKVANDVAFCSETKMMVGAGGIEYPRRATLQRMGARHVDATDKPIGYWLKHLHNLIEAQFEATLADLGMSRRHWQLLNLLSAANRSPAEAEQALAPFWGDATGELDMALNGADGLVPRGWAVYDMGEDKLALTDEGRDAQARSRARVGETRRTLMQGLPQQQYAETVHTLSVMARNIEAALASRVDAP